MLSWSVTLGERALPRGMRHFPHPRCALPDPACRRLSWCNHGAKRIEPDERHVVTQGLPGPLRGLPTVAVHAVRGIIPDVDHLHLSALLSLTPPSDGSLQTRLQPKADGLDHS